MFIVPTLLVIATSAPAATGVPTCFPISSSVRQLLEHGRVGAPVFVEEYSACEVRRELAPTAVAVPSELTGRAALDYIVTTFAAFDTTRSYAVSARAGGWLIAPAGVPTVVDQVVDIDPGACPTVAAAERCIFQQVMEQSGRWFGHPTFKDQRHVMANAVRLDDVVVLEALRAIYAPHEVGEVVGFSMELRPWPPDRYDGSFRLMWEPKDELGTPPALNTRLEPDLPPPGAPAPR